MIKLIINADDFGYTKLFNKMILELINEGSVTSTSVMIDEIDENQEKQVKQLLDLHKEKPITIGLHVYFKNTNFKAEIERQVAKFLEIFNFNPEYLDIHKTDYLKEGYPVILEYCKDKNLPCKNLSCYGDEIMKVKDVVTTKESLYSGTEKSFNEIEKWLTKLKGGVFYVINFHPGYYDPDSTSGLNREREEDADNIRKITSNLTKYNIDLVNFNDLTRTSSV